MKRFTGHDEPWGTFIDIKRGSKEYWKHLSVRIEEFCKKRAVKYINYFYHEELVKEKTERDKAIAEEKHI